MPFAHFFHFVLMMQDRKTLCCLISNLKQQLPNDDFHQRAHFVITSTVKQVNVRQALFLIFLTQK